MQASVPKQQQISALALNVVVYAAAGSAIPEPAKDKEQGATVQRGLSGEIYIGKAKQGDSTNPGLLHAEPIV
jgi:hypothetical protein